jgi:hypothetical protein
MEWRRDAMPAIAGTIIIIAEAIIADREVTAAWVVVPAGRNRTIIALGAGSRALIER